MKKFNMTEIQMMMCGIVEYGIDEVWADIETEPNALKRLRLRKLLSIGIFKIEQRKQLDIDTMEDIIDSEEDE